MNVILRFQKNKKAKGKTPLPISFYKKKVCFVTKDSKNIPNPEELWECFVWVEKEKYNLVKPFKKISNENLEQEKKRVDEFNKEIETLNTILKKEKDFQKIIFDKDINKPYLLSDVPLPELKEKYSDFIIIKKDNGTKWLRPILNAEDRKEYQRQCI
ncbi:hypothetical protein JXB41_00015 [Candidatus Woesearchaeota archaeon]|nr:hypothetical protein [Candidatus Woesearchaeota archaeon]